MRDSFQSHTPTPLEHGRSIMFPYTRVHIFCPPTVFKVNRVSLHASTYFPPVYYS